MTATHHVSGHLSNQSTRGHAANGSEKSVTILFAFVMADHASCSGSHCTKASFALLLSYRVIDSVVLLALVCIGVVVSGIVGLSVASLVGGFSIVVLPRPPFSRFAGHAVVARSAV